MRDTRALLRAPLAAAGPRDAGAAEGATHTATAALAFSVALAVLVVGPPLLPQPFAPYPLLTIGMVLDMFTPVVLLPAAWWLFRRASPDPLTALQALLFVGIIGVVIEGQAMHLAANAIGEQLAAIGGSAKQLTDDLDEFLSHMIWHGGLLGLSVLMLSRASVSSLEASPRGALVMNGVAALVFGATWFLMVVEGGTGVIGVPGAVVVTGLGLWKAGPRLRRNGVASLFVGGYLFAALLFLVWAALNGWTLPQFSEVGLL